MKTIKLITREGVNINLRRFSDNLVMNVIQDSVEIDYVNNSVSIDVVKQEVDRTIERLREADVDKFFIIEIVDLELF